MFWSRVNVRWPSPWRSARSRAEVDLGRARVAERQVDGDRGQAGRALRPHAGAPAPGRDVAQDRRPGRPRGSTSTSGRSGCGRSRASSNASCQRARNAIGAEAVERRTSCGPCPARRGRRGRRTRRPAPRPRPARRSRGTKGCSSTARDGDLPRLPPAQSSYPGTPSTTHRDEPGVVEQGVVAAARRAAQRHVQPGRQHHVQFGRPGDERVGHVPGVGEAVERLVQPDAGVLGAHHVADRVTARRPGRQPVAAERRRARRSTSRSRTQCSSTFWRVVTWSQSSPCRAATRARPRAWPVGSDPTGDPDPDHEHVVLALRAHAVGLERVAVLGSQPVVALDGQAVEVDGQAGALGCGDVRSCHATDCGEPDPARGFLAANVPSRRRPRRCERCVSVRSQGRVT